MRKIERKLQKHEKKLKKRDKKKFKKQQKKTLTKKTIFVIIILSIISSLIALYLTRGITQSIITLLSVFVFLILYIKTRARLKRSQQIKKIELVFPDFLQLMSSNLRAGMTIDKALLTSSRKEFAPLDKEILQLGKDIITGKSMESALKEMSKRIKSEKIDKTIRLLISGIRSGGNLAILLEETSSNIRERAFIEKKAASNVLMYEIFIFFAVAIGAPALFGLSSVLVSVLTGILSGLPDFGDVAASTPFALTQVSISPEFITYFSLTFLIVTDLLGSLVLGLITKGEEKAGIKYLIPLTLISVVIFFIVKIMLSGFFSNLIG